ncbi:MAG: hypothetical protein ACJA1L_001560 [Paracoccaceae bacterium]|jgi:hypothetical protein
MKTIAIHPIKASRPTGAAGSGPDAIAAFADTIRRITIASEMTPRLCPRMSGAAPGSGVGVEHR